ncbi:Phosphate acyltransferase [Frankliniella fusca]|uniref:Phosphate acyltransferase n=1 Tax=Frankliniella fusca TaxID=407009 RepID=A0AAE1HEL5_9NEOP|nr:Phosphate acyltransferase [Frankliniella fusca]
MGIRCKHLLGGNISFEHEDLRGNASEDEASGNEGDDADRNRTIHTVITTPESSSDEEDHVSDDEGGDNLVFDGSLDFPLDIVNYCTMKDSLILDLALLVRHHLSYEALIQIKYFVTVSLRKQLQTFLNTPGAAELLSYRGNNNQRNNTICDIFDGREYKRLQNGITSSNDFTLTLNVDACKMSMASKLKITPVFLRLNEINPQLRKKIMFLALFVDLKEPNMNSHFKAIVPLLNDLSKRGISWNRSGSIVKSRFFTICFCVDAKARAQLLNMNSHLGHYGCTYCTINGVRIADAMRYSANANPPFEDRSHAEMKLDMEQADRSGINERGHKGLTVLADIEHLDLAVGNAVDDLHNIYECCVPAHMNLILKATPRLDERMGYELMCTIIDDRMKKIKTPESVSRKPGVTSILNRGSYKGNEWSNFIKYYAVPCLQYLIHQKYIYPLELLSSFAFILSQDKITEEDLLRSERIISEYLIRFEELYGIARTRLNMHALVHAPKCVRNLGPCWVVGYIALSTLKAGMPRFSGMFPLLKAFSSR